MTDRLTSEADLEADSTPKSKRLSNLPIMIVVGTLLVVCLAVVYGLSTSGPSKKNKQDEVDLATESQKDYNTDRGKDAVGALALNTDGVIIRTADANGDPVTPSTQEAFQKLQDDALIGQTVNNTTVVQADTSALEQKIKELEEKLAQQQFNNINQTRTIVDENGNTITVPAGMGSSQDIEEQKAVMQLKKEIAQIKKQAFLKALSASSKTNFQVDGKFGVGNTAMSNYNSSSDGGGYGSGYNSEIDAEVDRANARVAELQAKRAQAQAMLGSLSNNASTQALGDNGRTTLSNPNDSLGYDNGFEDENGGEGGFLGQRGNRRGRQSAGQDRYNNLAVNGTWDLNQKLTAPRTAYIVRAGFVIPATMISGINSDLPGQIMAQVTQNVYDTATGKYLLIPQGTRLVGTYDSGTIGYGQERIMIAWQRLVFPDNKTLDLGSMPGADLGGYSGFADKVNNHWWKLISSAFLMSGITAGISIATDDNSNNDDNDSNNSAVRDELTRNMATQLGEVITKVIEKNLNISPTIEIRPGYQFNVTVTKDLTFGKPYSAFDYNAHGL